MKKRFKSFRIHQDSETKEIKSGIEEMSIDQLTEGEVIIRAEYSSINFKDALAATGKGKILRKFPLNGGVDVSGIVEESKNPSIKEGSSVLVNGCGLGETLDGGYSQYVRVPSKYVISIPDGLTSYEAMALGTAGFTAGLSLYRMEQLGQTPEMGDIVVTGASGGVGTLAIQILSSVGYSVVAVSGKKEKADFLRTLGASRVITPEDFSIGSRPLENAMWGGAIDNVGGQLLEGLIRSINLWGNIASVGLASDPTLSTTIMPFILRGVSLIGISSTNCPQSLREEIWGRLAQDWKPTQLKEIISEEVNMEEMFPWFEKMLQRKTFGRIIVKIN